MNIKTPQQSGNKPPTPAAYNAFVATTTLQEVRLVKSDFALNPEGFLDEDGWVYAHACELDSSHYDSERDLLFAFLSAEAFATKKRKRLVSVKCRYVVVYSVSGKPEESVVDAFAKRVARFTAFPYFRAHFADLMSQAGMHVPPLPVLKETRPLPQPTAIQPPTTGAKPQES